MKRKVFFLLCLFVLSRVLFINPFPVFFDSPEYLERLANPNYFQAIASGHLPFHITYGMLFWPIFQSSLLLGINPSFAVIFIQIIFSAIAIYCFYCFVTILANKKVALFATILGSLFPLYWITNVTIMAESTYINFFFISLFFLASYVKRKNNSKLYLLIGSASYGLSFLNHPLIILWTPFLLFTIYSLRKEKIRLVILSIIITAILMILLNGFFAGKALQISFSNGIHKYLFGEDLNVLPKISSFLMILRFIRYAYLPILQNNSALILLITILSLIKIFKINKKLFITMILWIFPSIIVNQWFNPLLSGRHSIIAEFGFAFLVALFLKNRKALFYTLLAYILIVYLPALNLLNKPIPYLVQQKFIQTLPKGLLIESHFARPQIKNNYSGEIVFVNEPGWNKELLGKKIDDYLNDNQPIFVTSQALSDPYGLYSGPFLLPQSLSYTRAFELQNIIAAYSTTKYAQISQEADLTIYKIEEKKKSRYPDIPVLKHSRRQISYFDPISQLYSFIERAMIVQSHSIIKE